MFIFHYRKKNRTSAALLLLNKLTQFDFLIFAKELMFVLVRRKSLPLPLCWINSIQGHKWLKFRPHKAHYISTSGDILFDQHIRLVFHVLHSSAITRGGKNSLSVLHVIKPKNLYRIISYY